MKNDISKLDGTGEFRKVYDGMRKKMPPSEKVIMPKDKYERDTNWRYREDDEEDDGLDYVPMNQNKDK